MPRPKKYLTEGERLEARRQQVRKNVEAFRQRKKHGGTQGSADHSANSSSLSLSRSDRRGQHISSTAKTVHSDNGSFHVWSLDTNIIDPSLLTSPESYREQRPNAYRLRPYVPGSESSESEGHSTRDHTPGTPSEQDLPDLDLDLDLNDDSDFHGGNVGGSSYASSLNVIDPFLLDQSTEPLPFLPGQDIQYPSGIPPSDQNEVPQPIDFSHPAEIPVENSYTDVATITFPSDEVATQFSRITETICTLPANLMVPSPHDMDSLSSANPSRLGFGWADNITNQYGKIDKCWPWLRLDQVKSSKKASRMVKVAVLAGSAQYFGRLRADDGLINASYHAYQKALRAMREQLEQAGDWESAAVKRDASFILTAGYSVMLVGLMEGFVNGDAAWALHLRGNFEIIRQAGPRVFQDQVNMAMLRSFQSKMIMFGIKDRQRLFIDSDVWRRVPYVHLEKSWNDRIWHLGHRIPSLLARCDAVMQLGLSGVDQAISVWRDFAILRRALKAWLAAFETDMMARSLENELQMSPLTVPYTQRQAGPSKPLFWYRAATRLLNKDVWTLPQVVEYSDLAVGESLNYYFLYKFILLTNALKLQSHILALSPTSFATLTATPLNQADLIAQSTDVLPIAQNLLGSAEYLATQQSYSGQPFSTGSPFTNWHGNMAIRYVARWLAEGAAVDRQKRQLLLLAKAQTAVLRSRSVSGAIAEYVADCILGTFPEVPELVEVVAVSDPLQRLQGLGNAQETALESWESDVLGLVPVDLSGGNSGDAFGEYDFGADANTWQFDFAGGLGDLTAEFERRASMTGF